MFLKLVIVFIGCLHFATSETYEKVNLTYGYQALCPFCLKFLDDQFYPGFKKLSNYINLELVIMVHVRDNGSISCRHGENECFISRAQACAFHREGITQDLAVEFLYCTEEKALGYRMPDAADIEACVNSVLKDVVSYQTVQTCMNSEESDKLLKAEYDRRELYGVYSVPWLGISGVKVEAKTKKQLRSDFVGTICGMLSNKPDVCSHLVH